jgi:CheY-like chemotaxis protein
MRLALASPAGDAKALQLAAVSTYLRAAQQRDSTDRESVATALSELRQLCASRDGGPDDPPAVIAEDEPLLAAGLRDALNVLWHELQVRALVEDGIQALRALEEHEPDVLSLDIEMPGLSEIEVAKQVRGRCHIAFVTRSTTTPSRRSSKVRSTMCSSPCRCPGSRQRSLA